MIVTPPESAKMAQFMWVETCVDEPPLASPRSMPFTELSKKLLPPVCALSAPALIKAMAAIRSARQAAGTFMSLFVFIMSGFLAGFSAVFGWMKWHVRSHTAVLGGTSICQAVRAMIERSSASRQFSR